MLPASELDAEVLKKAVPDGNHIKARLWAPRNLKFDRWWWALMSTVSENHEIYDTKQKLHLFLKITTGEIDHIVVGKDTILVPKSTNFSSMDGAEFKIYVDRALKVIEEQLWHNSGVRRQTIVNEVDNRSNLKYKDLTQ